MKNTRNLLKAAFQSISKNRMRSLLTSLGIIIGVSAVIVMVSIGEGSQEQIENNINALGTNLLIAYPGSASSGGARMGAGTRVRFSFADVEKLKKDATLLSAVSPLVMSGGQVIGGGNNWSTIVYGVSTDYFQIREWEVEYGALFTEKDISAKRKVAILGKTVANELFPDQDPTGQDIRIRNVPFEVIGVLKSKGQSGMGQDQDDMILAPSTTVFYRLKGGRWVDMINASAVSIEDMDAAKDEMSAILRVAHKIDYGQDDDFTVRSQTEITEAVTETSRTMTLLLGAIAAVSLVVGGIGIMNIMLVSVTERTREIGIRLSVGARASDIMIQFLTEAVVLSISGGILGIVLSGAVIMVLDKFTTINTAINPEIIFVSFIFSAIVGIFFGFYPARKAAAMDPITALRYE